MTEAETSEKLRSFFDSKGWEYKPEWVIEKSGKIIDYLVKAPYDGGHIFFGVECKKDLLTAKATELADYLEQASSYSRDLDMPVFLAPVFCGASPSNFYGGGTNLSAISAFNIFGGRFNVGMLIKQIRYWGGEEHTYGFMILRGGLFWDDRHGFNLKRLNMVCSTGSAKERKDIKVWK